MANLFHGTRVHVLTAYRQRCQCMLPDVRRSTLRCSLCEPVPDWSCETSRPCWFGSSTFQRLRESKGKRWRHCYVTKLAPVSTTSAYPRRSSDHLYSRPVGLERMQYCTQCMHTCTHTLVEISCARFVSSRGDNSVCRLLSTGAGRELQGTIRLYEEVRRKRSAMVRTESLQFPSLCLTWPSNETHMKI